MILVRVTGDLPADEIKASAFLLCAGVILVCIGCAWLFSKPRGDETEPSGQPDHYLPVLLKMRPFVERGAVAGMILIGIHAVALLFGVDWLTTTQFRALISVPLLILLFTLRIAPRGPLLLSYDIVSRWSAATRIAVILVIRTGWLGYLAIALVWPSLPYFAHLAERPSVRFVASCFIFLLYASQILILHFGEIRPMQGVSTARE